MSSISLLVLATLLSFITVAQSRPRERNNKGLYDDLKPVPFVDNPDEYGYMYGVYSDKRGKKDNNAKHGDKNADDPLEQYYEKFNKDHNRFVKDDGIVAKDNDVNDDNKGNPEDPDLTQLPVEGGVEDTKGKRFGKEEKEVKKGEQVTAVPRERVFDDSVNQKERAGKTGHRHGKHGKKNKGKKRKSGKKSGKKSRKEKTPATSKPESDENFLGSVDQEPGHFNMHRFLKEHPDLKENVGTISDDIEDVVTTTPADVITTTTEEATTTTAPPTPKPDYSEDDDGDDDDMNNSDLDDDFDDDAKDKDSESNDKSSEEYEFYDYYDEDGDSSYSSSEKAAENNHYGTPYDWFKQYDKMFGDQPAPADDDSKSKEQKADKTTTPKVKELRKSKTTTEEPVKATTTTTKATPKKEHDDKVEMSKASETIPKTDIEPSTSPNPPTPQKDVKSTVTQPAVPQWKQKLNSWNYIESRPVESCRGDSDCTAGRMCKFGLCLCGQPDFCDGHNKPVCGSDGQLYDSHCELHRTACILGFHIRIDHENTCMTNIQPDSVDIFPIEKVRQEEGKSEAVAKPIVSDKAPANIEIKEEDVDQHIEKVASKEVKAEQVSADSVDSKEKPKVESDKKNRGEDILDLSEVSKDVVIGGVMEKVSPDMIQQNFDEEFDSSELAEDDDYDEDYEEEDYDTDSDVDSSEETNKSDDDQDSDEHGNVVTTPITPEEVDDDDKKYETPNPADSGKIILGEGSMLKADSAEESGVEDKRESESDDDDDSLVPLFCTPDVYMKFKADVLEYHCIYFDQPNCDKQTQEEKEKLADMMFNDFDSNYDGQIEREELWEMQLRERIDNISSLCTLLDIVTFDELGERNGKLSADEFIQAFDIPDLLEHKLEVVPLLTTVGNGLEVKCDVTGSTDVVWKRNNIDLSLLDFPGISVLSDGSLFIETIGVNHVSNFTCYDRKKPSVKQMHMLTIQKPPHVIVSPVSPDALDGDNVVLHCHAEGFPRSTIEWQFDDVTIQQGAKYSIRNYDNSLTVNAVRYSKDSGFYKCIARNSAGVAEASIELTVHPDNDTRFDNEIPSSEESFIVFHDDGYTMHEPSLCLTQRHVSPDFGNFYYIPDELDAPPALCESGVPCVWGSAINVRDTFVYATQPRENRIVVIDVKGSYNPNQVIFTDHIPVALHYIDHLDEVWVLCWNGESDNGSKTIVIIRNASQKIQHHAIHTQPIGNRFDLVQDLFLPPESELHHPYKYGYTVHNGQQGLFKIELITKKYLKAVDLTKYACVPSSVAFVPLGGHVLVQCVQKTASGETSMILNLDYITDVVTQNFTIPGTPYVTPDSKNVVIVDQDTGKVSVYKVTGQGNIERHFEVSVESSVDKSTFHKARYYSGYDLYLVSAEAPVIFSISLTNGQVDTISNVGESDPALFLPWAKKSRPLVSGDIFSDYLSSTSQSSMVILDGHHHNINCDFKELSNPTVLTYTHLD